MPDEGNHRNARPETHLHVLRRAAESDDADVDASVYAADEWLLEKTRKPRGNCGPILHVLQLRTGASNTAGDASDGSRHCGSRLVGRGNRRLIGRLTLVLYPGPSTALRCLRRWRDS